MESLSLLTSHMTFHEHIRGFLTGFWGFPSHIAKTCFHVASTFHDVIMMISTFDVFISPMISHADFHDSNFHVAYIHDVAMTFHDVGMTFHDSMSPLSMTFFP